MLLRRCVHAPDMQGFRNLSRALKMLGWYVAEESLTAALLPVAAQVFSLCCICCIGSCIYMTWYMSACATGAAVSSPISCMLGMPAAAGSHGAAAAPAPQAPAASLAAQPAANGALPKGAAAATAGGAAAGAGGERGGVGDGVIAANGEPLAAAESHHGA